MLNGYLFGVLATLIWAGNFVIATTIVGTIEPATFTFWRWITALVVFVILFYKTIYKHLHLLKEHFILFNLAGLFGVGLFHNFVYLSATYTTTINISLIATLSPLIVFFINKFRFKNSIHISEILGFALAFLGLFILITDGNIALLTINIGDIIMLMAAIMFALYSIIASKKPTQIPQLIMVFAVLLFGALYTVPFYLYEVITHKAGFVLDIANISIILYTAIFASIISYFLWNKAIELINSTRTSIMYFLVPIFSALLMYIIFDEVITLWQLLSMGLIFIGMLLTLRSKHHT